MATVAEQLAISYARARAVNPSLRRGQFMQRVFQGRYKNEQSAYQAYNQTIRGKRSGKRLGKLSEEAQPPVQSAELREKFRTGELKRRPRPGGTREGLWKINISYTYIDEEGKQQQGARSFVAESMEYTTLMDIPYIREIIEEAAYEYLELWSETGSIPTNYENVEIEVIPIYRFDTHNVVDLDEGSNVIIESEWPE